NFSKTQRLRVMEERSRIMEQLRENTRRRVLAFVQDTSRYHPLLRDLIRQALLGVRADAVVRTRREDAAAVRGMLREAEEWYAARAGARLRVTLSDDPLDAAEAWGGVVVTSQDGHIICNLTLACRTRNCFADQLPAVRYFLFNAAAVA
ncbi:ATP synthase, partial [Trypanosoma conorhini]